MIIAKVQVSIFCNQRIEPTAENISYLMKELQSETERSYLPSVVTVPNFDIMTNQIKAASNLVLQTTDQFSQINCFDNRIDSIVNRLVQSNDLDLESTISIAVKAISVVLRRFDIQGNRLAVNIYSWDKTISGTEFMANEMLSSPFGYYKDKKLIEWSNRVNTRVSIDIDKQLEILNVISDLSVIKNEETNERRLQCLIDINTISENAMTRFSTHNLEPFCKESIVIAEEIINSFGGE